MATSSGLIALGPRRFHHLTGDDDLLDLAGAFIDAEDAHVAIETLDGILSHVAGAAEQLQAAEDAGRQQLVLVVDQGADADRARPRGRETTLFRLAGRNVPVWLRTQSLNGTS